MKTIDCPPNELAEVQLRIGDVVWTGTTSYPLAIILVLWTNEIETRLFADEQERVFVPLTLREADKIVGTLIEPKLRDLKKKGSSNE